MEDRTCKMFCECWLIQRRGVWTVYRETKKGKSLQTYSHTLACAYLRSIAKAKLKYWKISLVTVLVPNLKRPVKSKTKSKTNQWYNPVVKPVFSRGGAVIAKVGVTAYYFGQFLPPQIIWTHTVTLGMSAPWICQLSHQQLHNFYFCNTADLLIIW